MTEIGEKLLIKNVSVKTFCRIPISPCGNNGFILNDGKISVVTITDQKLEQSWTLTHPHSLTCPATFDKSDSSIYCVMDNKVLLNWSLKDSELKLKTAEKAKFQETVFAVLPVHKQSPIILFSSGKILKCRDLGLDDIPKGHGLISKGEEIVWADTIASESTIQVVYIGLTKKTKAYTLYNFTLGDDIVSENRVQSLVNGSSTLVSYCLNKQDNSLYTAWSSGTVLSHQLDSQTHFTVLPKCETSFEPILSIDSVDENHIVIFKSNCNFKGFLLEMWDIKFVALKTKKMLKMWPVINPQITVLGSSIFISNDEELFEVSYHVEKSSLAAAVGKTMPDATVPKEFKWSNGKLTTVPYSEPVEIMDSEDLEIIPNDPTELNAKRLVDEGSDFLNYIPESDLVKLLRLGLRYKVKEVGKFSLDIEPDVILCAIFSTSFTDEFLVQCMKKLSLEESIITLEVLISFLNLHAYSENTHDQYPTDLQLLNWIFLVYQSHMEVLLLSKDAKCKKVLRRLFSCISEKVNEYEDYSTIQNLCVFLQSDESILPEKYMSGKYCIESLDT